MSLNMPVDSNNKIGWKAAAGIVIANMIGTGVFTSLGFQLEAVKSTWSILLLWGIGGFLALGGAFIYAELAGRFKRTGGDYVFLSSTVHPLAGYLYAWVSLTAGTAAPVAIAAMAMIHYSSSLFPQGHGKAYAVIIILIVSILHSFSIRRSNWFHSVLTIVKIAFAIALVAAGLLLLPSLPNATEFSQPWVHELLYPGFAVSLIYVSYAYTGWNSAVYIAEEIRQPEKNIPIALITATTFVAAIYLLLQLTFLLHSKPGELNGKIDVALITFGDLDGGKLLMVLSLLISIQLISTISGYLWVGPRITYAMARDSRIWKGLSITNNGGVPVRALWFNSAVSILLILTGSFEKVLIYTGFVLQLMGTLTVAGALKITPAKGQFRTPFRPLLHLLFIGFSLWILAFTLYERPAESLAGLAFIGAGILLYFLDKRSGQGASPS